MLDRRSKGIALSTLISLSISFVGAKAAMAITPDALAQVIYKAKILAPGTQLRIHIKGEQALISSFRNERANDKDCKIEALIVGKTVFDAEPSITSVTYYFFNNRAPNEYKAATIRTTDVKAFEGGAVNQDTLLSTIDLKAGKVQDAVTALESRMMLAAAARRDVQVVDKGEDIDVTCKMPQLSDDEYRLEAYKIAESALRFGGNTSAKRVRVMFFSPSDRMKFKQVTVSAANLSNIETQIASALRPLDLREEQARLMAKDVEPADGPLMAERSRLLRSIQELEDKGVGVGPFIRAYQAIDEKAASGDDSTLPQEIKQLSDTVEEQQKRYADAKNFKAVKDKAGGGPEDKGPKALPDAKKTASKGNVSRWALGFFPMPESEILRDPDSYLAQCKTKFEQQLKGKKAEQDERYPLALMWIAEVLKTNDRAPEARKFEDQARALAARIRAK